MATKGTSEVRVNGEDYTVNDPNVEYEFSASTAYKKGEFCYYQGKLYIFTTDHSAGAWNADHVSQRTVGGETTQRIYADDGIGASFNHREFMSTGWLGWTACSMNKGQMYRITALSTNATGMNNISLRNKEDTTATYTVVSGSLPILTGQSIIISPDENIGKINVYMAGMFAIDCFVPMEEMQEDMAELLKSTKQRLDVSAAGWSNWKSYDMNADMEYAFMLMKDESSNNQGCIALELRNAAGSYVTYTTKSGGIPFMEGETLKISPNAKTSEFRAYFVGSLRVENDSLEIKELYERPIITDGYLERDSTRKALYVGKDVYKPNRQEYINENWSDWISYKFKANVKYKLTAVDIGSSGILDFNLKNDSDTRIAYTVLSGGIPMQTGDVMEFVPEGEATLFKIYADGTFSVECSQESVSWGIAEDIIFGSITEACEAVQDSSYLNQYEIIVMPGVYNEMNIMVPPYTHVHGAFPNSVIVTSKDIDNASTLPVIEQRNASTKLSNMEIVSYNGYCIHYDVALHDSIVGNENLILNKAGSTGTNWSIIGGGCFAGGTKYVWKECIFKSTTRGTAACHTNVNAIGLNTHLVFDACSFINCAIAVGNVGGAGHCVVEIKNCQFDVGEEGLQNWTSRMMTLSVPQYYRYDKNEWQIIGGGNKNFAPAIKKYGKTIRLSADYPITISGNAVPVLFGYNPAYRNEKTSRLDCSVTSELYIDDTKTGSSENVDVYELWKRLGDCSVNNKILYVTVNGETKTCIFNSNYQTNETQEEVILAEMQDALTNVTVEKVEDTAEDYDFRDINTSEVIYIKCADEDIVKGEFITHDGHIATGSTPVYKIAGIACMDAAENESVKVWTSAFKYSRETYEDGEYGLDENGELDGEAQTKVGFIKNNIFYRYQSR